MISLVHNTKSKKHIKYRHSSKQTKSKSSKSKSKSKSKSSKSTSKSKSNNTSIKSHHKKKYKRNIEKYCKYYKTDINGKINKPLYNSCKTNKYCRKYKCKNIDEKLIKGLTKKLGSNYNNLIVESLFNDCHMFDEKKERHKCENNALIKFYKTHDMNDIYDKVLECDNKTCSKEKKKFNTNLFNTNHLHFQKKQLDILEAQHNIEEPDIEMIEKN